MARLTLSLLITATCWAQPGPSASVSGNVTEVVTGIPMQGAYVQARWKGGLYANARTDSQGHYVLSNLPATTVYVAAVRKGSQRPFPRRIGMNLAPGDFAVQNFALQPASAIVGTISELDTGASVSGCHVSAFRKVTVAGVVGYIMDIPAGTADTDANTGHFEIADLDVGEYVLFVEPGPTNGIKRDRTCQGSAYYENSSRRDTAATIAIAKPGNTTVNIRLKEPATHAISGVV
jgi:hypothetical protein